MGLAEADICSTIGIDEVASEHWDAVVIGAGPAGAMAARQLSLSGARVLLVDRATFPRSKVCGCSINGAAMGVLEDVGLGGLLRQLKARDLGAVHLETFGRFARIPLTEGVALSRDRLDAALIGAAIDAGVEFLDQTQALIRAATLGVREIVLKREATEWSTSAKAIVVAGGLGCRIFAAAESEERDVSPSSRVGAGVILDVAPAAYATGTIYMICHGHGYVGLVRLEDDRLDIAAALDAKAIKNHKGIPGLVRHILATSNLPIPEQLTEVEWHGTGRLTQQRKHVASARCFFIGDAAEYVEPFTGEGIAWALASGRAVAPIVSQLLQDGDDSAAERAWTTTHHSLIANRSRLCRVVCDLLRYPILVSFAVRVLAIVPSLARPVIRSLNGSFTVSTKAQQQ
jgi:flavin-dependent dehydrogenase